MSENDSLPCSQCLKYHPSSNFSKGQLSKGGRRKCQTCLSPGAQKAARAQQQKADEAQRQLQLKAQQEKAERERQKQEEERKQREERERIAREAEAARQQRLAEERAQREAEAAARKLLQPQLHEGYVLPTSEPRKLRRPGGQQDQTTLNEYRAFREKLQSPTCASLGKPDAEYPKVIPLDTLIATPLSTSTEKNPLVARVPTDVWRIVIELLKKARSPPSETNLTTDANTLKLMSKFESKWGPALRSRSCILSFLQSCRAVFLNTRPLFANHLENYLTLVKGYYNFESIVIPFNHNFPLFPFTFCCALEDDGICRGSMQIFDREKKIEFDSYDLQPHFAPTLADNHEETIKEGTSNIRPPGKIRVKDLLPQKPRKDSPPSLKPVRSLCDAAEPKKKEASKGWALHHITLRLFAKHDSLIESGVTVHERSKFLFSDYSDTDANTQRVPFFETNLFVDVTPYKPAVLEPDEQIPSNEASSDDGTFSLDDSRSDDEPPSLPPSLRNRPGSSNVPQLPNNNNNLGSAKLPRQSQFIFCRGNAAPNSNANATTSGEAGEQLAVKLLTPREFYEKQERHPVRVQQRELEEKFRQEYNRSVDEDHAWSGIPSRHRPHLKDSSDPAKDIQTKFGNSVVKISEFVFNRKFSELEDLIIRQQDRCVD